MLPKSSFLTIRLFVDNSGSLEEIGAGYVVGPGHGLIISKAVGNVRVGFSDVPENKFCRFGGHPPPLYFPQKQKH